MWSSDGTILREEECSEKSCTSATTSFTKYSKRSSRR